MLSAISLAPFPRVQTSHQERTPKNFTEEFTLKYLRSTVDTNVIKVTSEGEKSQN